jgi:hypothetical protein
MTMHRTRLVVLAALALCSSPSLALAGPRIPLCHTGIVTLLSFEDHLKALRELNRYTGEDIDGLAAQQRKGGAAFFSSQIIVQEEPAASAMYDLRTVHGLNDAKKYRNLTEWTCDRAGYPTVTFVGFRVRAIDKGTILVSRAPGAVNVISLKRIDARLGRRIKVRIQPGNRLLCDDIAKGCIPQIFYERG